MAGDGITVDGKQNSEIFVGHTKNSDECAVRCIGKIQEYSYINGVTFRESGRGCICKIKMAQSVDRLGFETCFLTSKQLLIRLRILLIGVLEVNQKDI